MVQPNVRLETSRDCPSGKPCNVLQLTVCRETMIYCNSGCVERPLIKGSRSHTRNIQKAPVHAFVRMELSVHGADRGLGVEGKLVD